MAKTKLKSGKGISADQSVEKLLQEAFDYLEAEDGERAERIFRKLLASGTDSMEVRTGLADALFLQGMMQDGDDEMEHAIRLAESEEDKAQLLAIKAQSMLNAEYPEAAAIAFMRIVDDYPQYSARYSSVLVMIMTIQGREKEAWRWFENSLANHEELPPVDVAFYSMAWLELMFEMGSIESKDKLTRMFKRSAEKVTNEEERGLLISELLLTTDRLVDGMKYREAECFVDLALSMDPSSPSLVEAKREIKRYAKVQFEIERMSRDEKLFPLVALRATEWFYEDDEGVAADELLDGSPGDLVDQLYQDRRSFANGIKRLRKQYPAAYEMFQEDWEELYDELVGKSSGRIGQG